MNRTSIVFLGSYGLSILGNSVAAVVLPLVVLQSTGSALDAGIVAAATAVPAVLAGLFMGGVVDRVHRRSVSIVTDLVSAGAMAALPLVDATAGLSLGWFVFSGSSGHSGRAGNDGSRDGRRTSQFRSLRVTATSAPFFTAK